MVTGQQAAFRRGCIRLHSSRQWMRASLAPPLLAHGGVSSLDLDSSDRCAVVPHCFHVYVPDDLQYEETLPFEGSSTGFGPLFSQAICFLIVVLRVLCMFYLTAFRETGLLPGFFLTCGSSLHCLESLSQNRRC